MNIEKIKNSKSFCFYPFLQLSTVSSGFFKPCAFFETVLTDVDGMQLKGDKASLESVWNSDGLQQMRKKMACGDKVDGCRQCYREEEQFGTSLRKRGIQDWIERADVFEAVLKTIGMNGVASHFPKILEFHPWLDSEHCDRVNSLSTMSNWSPPSAFCNDVYRTSKNLERIDFAGGEPILIPEVKKLIKHLVTNGDSQHIHLYYNSNLTRLNEDLIELAQQFRTFTFIASIDGTKSVQEYVRCPSEWVIVKDNFERLKNLIDEDQFRVIAHFTVQAYNICDLVDFLDWMEELDGDFPAFFRNPVSLSVLTNPDFLDIQYLPRKVKMYASRRIDEYWHRTKLHRFPDFKAQLQRVQSMLNEPGPDVYGIKMSEFNNFTQSLDDHRNQQFRNINPFLFYACLEDATVGIPRSIQPIENKFQRLYVERPIEKIWGKISSRFNG